MILNINTLISLLLLTTLSCSQKKKISANSQLKPSQNTYTSKIDREKTKDILYKLASDEFEGRKPNTDGYKLANKYVENFLKINKIKPLFEKTYQDKVVYNNYESHNIVGLIGDYDKTKPHIIIGAHLDHLGKIKNDYDSIYNGANDNASGVTAVLQIAKELNKHRYNKNIIVALFTLEESGLIGSKHLSERLKKEKYKISYVLNFEMIGKTKTTGKNKVYITGFDKSDLAKQMNTIANRKFVEFLPKAKEMNLFKHSDNYPFYKVFNIPSHTISSFDFENYNHYHKNSDEASLLDIDNTNDIINSSTSIIHEMLKRNIQLKAN